MRVLLIKTSSMGDVIHALPALTDAGRAIPGIQFDWVVEEPFAEIPSWHPLVNKVIPVALRRWRKHLFAKETRAEWTALRSTLREKTYDVVLDAQGLAKSALLCLFATGRRVGLDFSSARETLAGLAYQKRCSVNFYQHAVVRARSLFAQGLGYELPETAPDFGLDKTVFTRDAASTNDIVFLHGTTWSSKQWPEEYWVALARMATNAGYRVKISGGNTDELARAQRIAGAVAGVDALPRQTIAEMARLLANAKAAVAVDTGFGHLSAALNLPTISIYGATNPVYTSAVGPASVHLAAKFPCAPCLKRECDYRQPSVVTPACYGEIPPEKVWSEVSRMVELAG